MKKSNYPKIEEYLKRHDEYEQSNELAEKVKEDYQLKLYVDVDSADGRWSPVGIISRRILIEHARRWTSSARR